MYLFSENQLNANGLIGIKVPSKNPNVTMSMLLAACMYLLVVFSVSPSLGYDDENRQRRIEYPCLQNGSFSCEFGTGAGINATCFDDVPENIINNLLIETVHFIYTYHKPFDESGVVSASGKHSRMSP